ncbi:hypothetical protein FRC01_008128 [Tulasnella sp. 417]|nr:hypothetical protein FRC01_008128 [Tulasnella sp. 417]
MSDSEAIVDFATLEREKENITANRNGHSALALQQTFSVPRNQRHQQLAAAKERFTQQLEEAHAESPDPLDAYVKFVEWTIDSYPSGKSSDSGLLPLLELATRTFKDDPQYKYDLRYLNLWLQYANLVEKPDMVYAYLVANDIGQAFSVLYEEYANTLERQGRRTKADEIYRLGLARKAKPLSSLQSKYEEFQTRMLTARPEAQADVDDNAPSTSARRTALGERSTGSRAPGQSAASSIAAPAPRLGNATNRGKISVFTDGPSAQDGQDYQSNEWNNLGSQSALVKENKPEAGPWVGERLHQVSMQTPKTPKFTVLKDNADDVRPLPSKTPEPIAIRAPSQRPPTETELLFHNPFKNYSEAVPDLSDAPVPLAPPKPTAPSSRASQPIASSSKAPPPQATSSTSTSQDVSKYPKPRAFIPPDPVPNVPGQPPRKPEKYMFRLELLWNEKEEKEYCASEVRAKSLGLLNKQWPLPPFMVQREKTAYFEPTKTGGAGSRAGRMSMAREPTVTINTKFAMNDVFDMFNGAGIDEEEDSFEEEAAPSAPQGKLGMGLPSISQNVTTPTPFGRSVSSSSSFKPFVDTAPASQPKPAPTPKFTPFVDSGPAKGAQQLNQSALGNGRPSQPAGMNRSVSGPSALGASTTKTPKIKPFVDPSPDVQQSAARGPLSARPLKESEPIHESDLEGPPAAPAVEPTPLRSRPAPSFKPFVDSGSAADVPPTPTPASGGRGPQIFGVPPTIQEGEGAALPPPTKSSRSFNIFQDAAPTKSSSPGQKPSQNSPSLPLDNIFTASGEDVFNNSRVHRDTSLSKSGLPDIKFVPSPDVTEDHGKAPSTPSIPGKENIDFGSLGQHGGGGHGHDDDSDWSEDDPVHDQDQGPGADEHMDDEEHGDEFDENEPPPSFRLKRFAAFDEMTPITERTYEFTRTSSDLTPSTRRQSLAAGRPRASEVGRPRKSVLPPRASLAPTGEEPEPFPNPCNPFEEPVLSELLNVAWVDFADHRDQKAGQLERLQRFGAKKLRTSTDKRRSSGVGETIQLTLGEDTFEIIGKLGEGGFGAVFLARLLGLTDYDAEEDVLFAMKAVKPCQLWEWTILARIRESVPEELLPSIIAPQGLYAFEDESFLLLDHCSQGTLLDCVNRAAGTELASQSSDGIVEPLVVFFTIELLRVVEGLHSQGVIHGDLKIDNCLLRLAELDSSWSAKYDPTGGNGWSEQGIRLIDFGRAIDTTWFAEGQTFCGDWPADARDCPEVREGRPWTFETDYWGLAGVVYCMLFRKYIETTAVDGPGGVKRYKIATPLKRYWNTDLWNRVFDILLNPRLVRSDQKLPISNELAVLREEMEQWLVVNSVKGKGGVTLKAMLKKILRWSM